MEKVSPEKERLSLLGIYGGKYRLLSNVPVAVALPLGTSMIPSIVRSRAQKNRTDVMYKIRLTIKFNMLLPFPVHSVWQHWLLRFCGLSSRQPDLTGTC